jgi:hypothetical protein
MGNGLAIIGGGVASEAVINWYIRLQCYDFEKKDQPGGHAAQWDSFSKPSPYQGVIDSLNLTLMVTGNNASTAISTLY